MFILVTFCYITKTECVCFLIW